MLEGSREARGEQTGRFPRWGNYLGGSKARDKSVLPASGPSVYFSVVTCTIKYMITLRHEEVKRCDREHTARKWQSQDSDPGAGPRSILNLLSLLPLPGPVIAPGLARWAVGLGWGPGGSLPVQCLGFVAGQTSEVAAPCPQLL